MKAIILGLGAAVLLAVGAAVVLDRLDSSTASRYSTSSVRL